MATTEQNNEFEELDLSPDTQVKHLAYGNSVYSTPKLSGILTELVDRTGRKITAKDVYFTEDIMLAGDYDRVGNITKELDGTGTLSAKDRTVEDVFKEVFTKELSGYISVEPKVTASLSDTSTSYEAGSKINVAVTGGFTDGEYKYGVDPDTRLLDLNNSTTQAWKCWLKDTANKIQTGDNQMLYSTGENKYTSARFNDEVTVKDGMNLEARVIVQKYVAQTSAYTNLGRRNDEAGFEKVCISGTNLSAKQTITCYRNIFIGSTADGDANINSNFVRTNLKAFKSSARTVRLQKNASSAQAELVQDAKAIVVAIPVDSSIPSNQRRSLSNVLLVSASNTPIKTSYADRGTIQVEGANGLYPITYRIYVYEPSRIGQDEVHDIVLA